MFLFWELTESPRWSPNICESGTGLTNLQFLIHFHWTFFSAWEISVSVSQAYSGYLDSVMTRVDSSTTSSLTSIQVTLKNLLVLASSFAWGKGRNTNEVALPSWLRVFCFVSLEGYCKSKPCHESVRDEVWLLVVRDACGSLWLSELEDQYFLDKIALIGTGVTCGFMGETYKEHNRRSLFEKRWPAMPALTGRGERDVLWWCLGH